MSTVFVPHEGHRHDGCWMAWPHFEDEWEDLEDTRAEVLAFISAVAETETVRLLVLPEIEVPNVPANVEVIRMLYGDAWTRDTGPVFARFEAGLVALCFRFDGWGGKYLMPGDNDLAGRIAAKVGVRAEHVSLTLEGGSLEFDGAGTLLTTRDCLLRRNPGMDEPTLTAALVRTFGVERVIWLDGQLANDHTDGHIDTLARFVEPGHAVCMDATGINAGVNRAVARQLRDAGLRVSVIPGVESVPDGAGTPLPASYCNYYLANDQVLVPAYGLPSDESAMLALGALFPGRRARSIQARNILAGGGALHCITQQQPSTS